MRALVSATDVTAVLRTHVDRVNDAARRLGCTSEEAAEVTVEASLDLVEALAHTPETVGDLVGGLYARARSLARSVRQVEVATPLADPVTAGAALIHDTQQDADVSAALAALPELRRYAVLLRDSYGLDVRQAAVGLTRDRAETARTVALARIAVAVAVDGRELPDMSGHDIALGDLGELSDGTASAAGRFAAVRRHVSTCPICANVLDLQTRGRALVGALRILGLPYGVRADLLAQAGGQATALLPSAAEILAELDGEVGAPRLISPARVGLALALAAVLGVGLGALVAPRSTGSDTAADLLTEPAGAATSVTSAGPLPTSEGPTPSQFSPRPVTVVSTTAPSKSATPSQTPSPSQTTSTSTTPTSSVTTNPPTSATQSTTPPADAAIVLTPTSGPGDTPITVTGSGFTPGATVRVNYALQLDAAETTVATDGTFAVSFTPIADGRPRVHTVTATDGTHSASAPFNQTT